MLVDYLAKMIVEVFGHWDGRELLLNAPRIIVVAQKV